MKDFEIRSGPNKGSLPELRVLAVSTCSVAHLLAHLHPFSVLALENRWHVGHGDKQDLPSDNEDKDTEKTSPKAKALSTLNRPPTETLQKPYAGVFHNRHLAGFVPVGDRSWHEGPWAQELIPVLPMQGVEGFRAFGVKGVEGFGV